MANDTTILNGDIGVYYFGNNRTKMMYWIGGTNTNYTMNQLYSAMATLLDESTTIDDGSAFSAETPVEYTIGKIDAGDNDPWYITFDLMERITGGALRTSGWLRSEGSNTGIIMVEVASASNSIVDADRGFNITHTDTDSGTLLEVISDGGTSDYLFIRPDSSASGDSFDNTTGTLTCNAHTATSITTAGISGEMIWANLYSIGTIEPAVHLYVYQGARGTTDSSVRVYSVNSTTLDYWSNGHFDVCVPIKDWKTDTFPVIDDGYLRVFGRKGGDLYSSFEAANSTASGGRNPVPLQTAVDLDQSHGTAKISTGTWGGDTFLDGEIIEDQTTGGRGILDLVNSTVDTEIVYFPIAEDAVGGDIVAFGNGNVIQGQTTTDTATSSSVPSDDGPADATWFTNTTPDLVIGNATADIDNDGTDEYYGLNVDANQNPLSEVYQWVKYICQYGQGDGDMIEQAFTDDLSQADVYGEEFEGGTAYFTYSAISGTIAEGESVTQTQTGGEATGVIVSHDTTNQIVMLRSTRGSFNASDQIDADDDADNFTPDGAGNFAAKVASPLGTFAGGTFFGARGVLLSDYLAADENSFILTDIGGTTRERPTSITLEVTNLVGTDETTATDDLVAIYRLAGSGLDIEKTTQTCDGGETAGTTTLAVDAIADYVPSAGTVILVDVDNGNKEYAIRYSSWDAASDTYTLAASDIPAADGGSTTTVQETGAFASTKRGDLVYNVDLTEVTYVKSVDSDDQITVEPAFTGDPTGDNIKLNVIPITVSASDQAFAAFMRRYAANTTEQVSIIYPGSTVYFRVKVRNTRATEKIKPYSSDGSTSGTDQSIPVVRTEDTIIS